MTDVPPVALQTVGESAAAWAVVAIASFALPVLFMLWVRNTERYRKEPLVVVIRTFIGGAVLAVLLGGVLSLALLFVFGRIVPLYEFLADRFANPEAFLLAIIIAPFAEELAKGLVTRTARRHMLEREDGLVYGATAGLGFSATENLLYGAAALISGGFAASLAVIALRGLSSSLLHASSSAVFGYGIAKHHLAPRPLSYLPYYVAAVGMHAAFNFFATFGALYYDTYGDVSYIIGFAAAIVFALIAISAVRGKIRALDRPA